jgi:outer membrane autotransporter protein
MKLGYATSASVLASAFLLFVAPGSVRADNTLEANGKHKDAITGVPYFTSTAQPAMLALNGGTIQSTDNTITVLPPGGLIGLEAQGTGSQITAKNPTILGLDAGQGGISAVSAINGGLVDLEGGKIEIAGVSSAGLLANSGTVDVGTPVTISMTGPNSYGVEAEGSGVVNIDPGTTITTSGSGGFGIYALAGGTVMANGIAITTSGFLLPGGFNADGVATNGGTIKLENSTITTTGDNGAGLHVLGGNGEIFGTNLVIATSGHSAVGAEADSGGLIQLSGGSINTSGGGSYGLLASGGGSIMGTGISVTTSGGLGSLLNTADGAAASTGPSGPGTIVLQNSNITANGPGANGLFASGTGSGISLTNSNVVSSQGDGALVENGANLTLTGSTISTSGIGGRGIFAVAGGTVTANGITITTSGFQLPGGFNADGAATMGGTIKLANSSITTRGDSADGLHVLGGNGEIFGTDLTIVTNGRSAAGAEADNGGLIQLSGDSINTSGSGSYGLLASSGGSITGTGISVTTSGGLESLLNTADGAAALTGSSGPGTIVLQNSNITANGLGANGLFVSGTGSSISLTNSNVVSSRGDGALVENGATLTLTGSSLTALIHGIVAIGGTPNTPNSIIVSGGNLITVLGDAFQIPNGVTNITVNNGATVTGNTALLRVLDPPGGTTVNLAASHASLTGDIFADPASQTIVNLTASSVLTGRVNPLLGLGGDLMIDGTSQWVMTGSSNVESLTVSRGASAEFSTLFNLARNTLTIGDLLGTGGRFGLNINLRRDTGDLIDITGISQGSHLLTFFDRGHGTDLRGNQSLLVVQTADGVAGFSGVTERAVFKYYVVHGNGSAITPDPNDWYLVRADRIVRDQVERPAGLPEGSIDTPVGLSTVDALSNAANAAIGTYGAGTPLFYADMDTLIQRLGELRLQSGESRVSLDSGGKAILPTAPAEEPGATIGSWITGFGNGMHINDQASRAFDQNTGGFQLGVDKRFDAFHGDLYVGGFLSYFNASRDFLDGGSGSTNALSVGTYATWLNPQGWYADLVLKYTQLWNYFNTAASDGSIATAQYSIPALGGSLEIGKRFNLGEFFIEPEAQLAGVWEAGNNYTASNGLNVGGSDQYSLRGRLGLRAGMHFSLSNGIAIEPYLKVSAVQEFLTGDQITLDDTPFFPTVSGTMVDAAAGLSARLNESVYLYGEYDYANGDKIRQPWAVNLGIRWQWGGKNEEPVAQQPAVNQPGGKEAETKQVELPPAKPTEPWQITIGGPGWLAGVNANLGARGVTNHVDIGPIQILKNSNVVNALSAEAHNGRFGLLGGYVYINAQDSTPGQGLVSKVDLGLQEYISQLAASWRLFEGPHGWLDALGGFRFFYVGSQAGLQANQEAINNASTLLVNEFAAQLTTPNSDLRSLILQNLNLNSLSGRNLPLPVPPLAGREPGLIRDAIQQIIQSQEPELVAAIRTNAQARLAQIKTALAAQIANRLTGFLNKSFSLYENWFDPFIGLRGRYNLSKPLYLTGEADIGGFGVGSEITWQLYGALGCQLTRNIYSEIGYRYLYLDYETTDFIFHGSIRGAQLTVGLRF